MADVERTLRTAYLISQYPAYSHAFIAGEIQALRRSGWYVQPFSINVPGIPDHPDTPSTVSILATSRARLLATAVTVGVRHPVALARTASHAVRWAAGRGNRLRYVLWQLFYLVEATFAYQQMRRQGLTHVHTHFANNSADVARLVVQLANAIAADRLLWTWSMTVHGPTDFSQASQLGLREKIGSAAFVTCISRYGLRQVQGHCDKSQWAKLHIVHMGVDEQAFRDRLADRRQDDPDREFRVLFVGRVVPQKAPDMLVDALEQWSAQLRGLPPASKVHVTVIGDGPLRAGLQARTANWDGPVEVSWLGARAHDEVLTWYEWADVFCLPSFSEGLPVVLMEAMASELSVVTTPIAAIPELVEDGVTGLLVPTGSSSALVAALERLRGDDHLRQALGRAGRAKVAAEFRTGPNAEKLGRLFAELLPGGTEDAVSGRLPLPRR